MKEFKSLLLFLVFLLPVRAFSLNGKIAITQYIHDIWTSDNGLPQDSVRSILQTQDGYLWIGTAEGLVRFDGVQFTTFNTHNTPALKSNIITSLAEGQHGTLWIGTYYGGLSSYKQGKFSSYASENSLSGKFIRALYVDRQDTLWIGTNDQGLVRYNHKTFTPYTTKNGLAGNSIQAICQSQDGKLWVGTAVGLDTFDSGQFTPFFPKKQFGAITALSNGQEGTMWIGTFKYGLLAFKDGKVVLYGKKQGLANNSIAALQEDTDGNLWVGTNGGGLYRLNHGKFYAYDTKQGLSDDTVVSIFEDHEGNLWVGTLAGGINCFRNPKFVVYGIKEGLSNDLTLPIYQSQDGSMWIGTLGGGLNNLNSGKIKIYTTRQGLSSNNVVSLLQDKAKALWIGTLERGLNRFKNGKFFTYTTKNGLTNDTVRALYQGSDGTLWIGTNGGGLDFFKNGKFGAYTVKNGLPNNDVRYIYQDSSGTLWLATSGGLSKFSNGKFTNYTVQNGLSTNLLNCIHEDEKKILWIGTISGGLIRFQNGQVTNFAPKDGLFDDTIYQILEDDKGNLWMSSSKGVFRVGKKELNDFAAGRRSSITSITYGKTDGLRSLACVGTTQPDGWKTRQGILWFPTSKGAASIDANHLAANAFSFPVTVEKVLVDNVPLDLTQKQPAILSPGKTRYEFHYTALSLTASEKINFKYKLEGFDKDWIDAGTRRVAYYTNIPPGKYRFLVKAGNADGLWSRNQGSFEFDLKPYFYQTYPFYAVEALVGLLAVLALLNVRTAYLKKRAKQLEETVKQRTLELEVANGKLAELARIDELTGLANRRRFHEVFELEWKRALRSKDMISLIMADVDFFKKLNDTDGHLAGDDCLKRIAAVFRSTVQRPEDLTARYGGEEFVVLLPSTDHAGANLIAEKIRAAVEALNISHRDSSAADHVTVSLGIATTVVEKGVSSETLIAHADEALYEAKASGRNRVVLFA